MLSLVIPVYQNRWCQPFRGACIYLDLLYTLILQFYVVLERKLIYQNHQTNRETILRADQKNARKHFYKIRS